MKWIWILILVRHITDTTNSFLTSFCITYSKFFEPRVVSLSGWSDCMSKCFYYISKLVLTYLSCIWKPLSVQHDSWIFRNFHNFLGAIYSHSPPYLYSWISCAPSLMLMSVVSLTYAHACHKSQEWKLTAFT